MARHYQDALTTEGQLLSDLTFTRSFFSEHTTFMRVSHTVACFTYGRIYWVPFPFLVYTPGHVLGKWSLITVGAAKRRPRRCPTQKLAILSDRAARGWQRRRSQHLKVLNVRCHIAVSAIIPFVSSTCHLGWTMSDSFTRSNHFSDTTASAIQAVHAEASCGAAVVVQRLDLGSVRPVLE